MGYPGELLQTYLSDLDLRKRESKTALATFKDGWIGRITAGSPATVRSPNKSRLQLGRIRA
jgi:hypothetical protein